MRWNDALKADINNVFMRTILLFIESFRPNTHTHTHNLRSNGQALTHIRFDVWQADCWLAETPAIRVLSFIERVTPFESSS